MCVDARASTELTIITGNGSVSFVAEDNWPVLSMQTKLPVAAISFQLPNPADIDTPHSTSIALTLYDLKSEQGQRAFGAFPPPAGTMSKTVMKWGGWTVTRQRGRTRVPSTRFWTRKIRQWARWRRAPGLRGRT
ncbi:hypothetical protein LP419_10165 [Massilia sp. H-1]|nr:hypothetical protein LP419_10165 [Massilia sp. H-1]